MIRQKNKGALIGSSGAAEYSDYDDAHSGMVEVDPKYGRKGKFPVSKRILFGIIVVGLFLYMIFVVIEKVDMSSSTKPSPSNSNGVPSNSNGVPSNSNSKSSNGYSETTIGSIPGQRIGNLDLVSYLSDGSPIGYVRIPRIQESETKHSDDDGKLHIIFSSGCNKFQHWQSELLLATAKQVGQRGRITRIVSGCYDKKAEKVAHRHQTFPAGANDKLVPMELLNRSVNENFGLFVTPAFDGAIDFPWINKPSSIKYFMQHARPELDRLGETIIAILDPDFIFLEPLSQAGAKSLDDVIATRGVEIDPGINNPIDVAKKGRPVAQRYGLESGWKKFEPIEQITGNINSPAKGWSHKDAAKWTSVGPPLILYIDDVANLSVQWERNMRPVLQVGGPDILADMWAYSIAAADLGLKHTTLDHYMISTWGTSGQAYPWVDEWESLSCNEPTLPPGKKHPTFIHLASNFKAIDTNGEEWMFHKGHVPADILDCDLPLIIEPPNDLYNELKDKSPKSRQKAWVVCHTIDRLNKVLIDYKEKFCPKGYEKRNLVRLIQRKRLDRRCRPGKDKWCFPLAEIEGFPRDWRGS